MNRFFNCIPILSTIGLCMAMLGMTLIWLSYYRMSILFLLLSNACYVINCYIYESKIKDE